MSSPPTCPTDPGLRSRVASLPASCSCCTSSPSRRSARSRTRIAASSLSTSRDCAKYARSAIALSDRSRISSSRSHVAIAARIACQFGATAASCAGVASAATQGPAGAARSRPGRTIAAGGPGRRRARCARPGTDVRRCSPGRRDEQDRPSGAPGSRERAGRFPGRRGVARAIESACVSGFRCRPPQPTKQRPAAMRAVLFLRYSRHLATM